MYILLSFNEKPSSTDHALQTSIVTVANEPEILETLPKGAVANTRTFISARQYLYYYDCQNADLEVVQNALKLFHASFNIRVDSFIDYERKLAHNPVINLLKTSLQEALRLSHPAPHEKPVVDGDPLEKRVVARDEESTWLPGTSYFSCKSILFAAASVAVIVGVAAAFTYSKKVD